MAHGVQQTLKYRPDVDGLRAFAVIAVVIFHYFPKMLPNGYFGVDIFFVISGYLISPIVHEELNRSSFSIGVFYAKRFRRILPALLLVLFSVFFAGYFVLVPSDLLAVEQHVRAGAMFVSNFRLFSESGYFDVRTELKPLLHLWSLAVEEQFYLIWPLILVAINKAKARTTIIGTICLTSLLASVIQVHFSQSAAFYLLHTRLWELILGYFLFEIKTFGSFARWFSPLSFCCLSLGMVQTVNFNYFPGWYAGLPVFGAAFFLNSSPDALLNRILSWRVFVGIGKISYPIYLWHWPLLALARLSLGRDLVIVEKSLALGFTLILSVGTYFLVEIPIRRIKIEGNRAGSCSARRVLAFGLVGLLAAVGLSSVQFRTSRHRLAERISGYSHYPRPAFRSGRCLLQPEEGFEQIGKDCLGSESREQIFIWGDSFSAELHWELNEYAKEAGLAFSGFAASNCLPALGFERNDRPNCKAFNGYVMSQILRVRPKVVVLFASWFPEAVAPQIDFLHKLDVTIGQLKGAGVQKIIVVGQVPTWTSDLYKILERHIMSSNEELPSRFGKIREGVLGADQILKNHFNTSDTKYVPLVDRLCEANECKIFLGSDIERDLVTFDSGHPTATMAKFIVNEIKPYID